MTPLKSKYKSLSVLIILFLISIPVFVSHYVSESGTNNLFQRIVHRKERANLTVQSNVLKDNVVLVKGESVTTNKCRLVFKGIEDSIIRLDLYLLEFDPESAYVQNISKEDAMKGFRMGDSEYQLISVNRKILKLKIGPTAY